MNAGLERDVNQYFAVLTGIKSVGVMGDFRTYDYTIALRAVSTTDFMTADWARIDYDLLSKISSRIVNEVKHVNRIVYDITSKPPQQLSGNNFCCHFTTFVILFLTKKVVSVGQVVGARKNTKENQ